MEGIVITGLIPLIISVYLLLLCTGKKKKKKVEIVQQVYATPPRESANSTPGRNLITPEQQSQKLPTDNGGEKRHDSHITSQPSQSRELPAPPPSEGENENNSATKRCSTKGADVFAVDYPENGSISTAPEGTAQINKEANAIEDDKHKYARVDNDLGRSESICLKVKSLDMNEANRNASHYAKVGQEDDSRVYAQVDEKELKITTEPEEKKTNCLNPGSKYTTPEYATIDKAKKGMSLKRKTESNEPPAPPIPERNFDCDDESDDGSGLPENLPHSASEDTKKAPVYDKLCVRESLEHIRRREEVEEERRQRYANLPSIDGVECDVTDVYQQIDETNPEAVYESVSQPGSADGTFGHNNAGYSSIGVASCSSRVDSTQSLGNLSADLQARPKAQHHYEQIDHNQMVKR